MGRRDAGIGRELVGEVLCPSGEIALRTPGAAERIVVAGLPRTRTLEVWGVRMIEPELAEHWRWLYVDVLPGARSIEIVRVGRVELGSRLLFADALGDACADGNGHGARCELETTWLPGSFEVLRDVDDQGRLSRVRIDIGSDEAVARWSAVDSTTEA